MDGQDGTIYDDSVVAFRVGVIEARNLVSVANHRSPTDPMAVVEVRILDSAAPPVSQSDQTNVVENTTAPKWNAVFDFLVPTRFLEASIVSIEVWDKSSFGRSFLGEVALALSELPKPSDYELAEESWYSLEIASDKSRIKRHIKLKIGTIPVLKTQTLQREQNDSAIMRRSLSAFSLSEEVGDWEMLRARSNSSIVDENLHEWTEIPQNSAVINNLNKPSQGSHTFRSEEPGTPVPSPSASTANLSSPQKTALTKVAGVAKLEILKTERFRPDSDYFLIVVFGTTSFRTKTIKKAFDGTLNAPILLVVHENERSFLIKFSIYSLNKFGQNDLIGYCTLKMSDVILHAGGFLVDIPIELKRQIGSSDPVIKLRGKFTTFSQMKRNIWLNVAEDLCREDYMVNKVDLWSLVNALDDSVNDEDISKFFQIAGQGEESEVNLKDFLEISDALPPEEDLFGLVLERLISQEDCDQYVRLAISGKPQANEASDFVISGFITETQARKGWFTRLVNNVANGHLDIGADNANVLVQDRETGELLDERMSTFIRLGIRSLYKSKLSSVKKGLDTKMVRAFLLNMTIRQGKKFNDPKSKAAIKPFVEFHNISVAEMLEPLDSFKTFNEFFYRKLKPGARKVASEDPRVAVSPADCRMTVFPTITEATRLWIKGKDFSIKNLLQSQDLANYFKDGSLAIFRLAPQDYHRYHAPVDGDLGEYVDIPGTYFTVNPMAIREREVDVFTENKRTYTLIKSKEFGVVAYIIIGAMLVGSICITSPTGTTVKRLDEIGYFAFGGSTIVCLFEKDAIAFDTDLIENSKKHLETLIKVGGSIGRALNPKGPQ